MQVPFGKLRAGFRLRLPYNHPSDEDLSLGTPATSFQLLARIEGLPGFPLIRLAILRDLLS
jgi:hypothetical protein